MKKIIFFALFALAFVAIQCKQGDTATSEHGFKYKHVFKNEGPKVTIGDVANVHYIAAVGDKVLMSTWDRSPEGFPLEIEAKESYDTLPADQLKNFWPFYDAITMMAKGDTMIVYQTIEEDMRKNLPPTIDSTAKEITLTIFVQDIKNKTEIEAAQKEKDLAAAAIAGAVDADLAAYKSGALKSKLVKLPSGVQILTKEVGTGAAITQGEPIEVNYYGALIADGNRFDDSFTRGQPLPFQAGAGQMIKGFDEAVMTMTHGTKATIFIPSKFGYGEQGRPGIPANSDLAFYIEVL